MWCLTNRLKNLPITDRCVQQNHVAKGQNLLISKSVTNGIIEKRVLFRNLKILNRFCWIILHIYNDAICVIHLLLSLNIRWEEYHRRKWRSPDLQEPLKENIKGILLKVKTIRKSANLQNYITKFLLKLRWQNISFQMRKIQANSNLAAHFGILSNKLFDSLLFIKV